MIEPAVASVTEKNGTGKRRRGPRSKGAWTVYVAGSRRVTGTEAGRKWVTEPREDARGRRAQCALLCPTKQQEPTYSVAQNGFRFAHQGLLRVLSNILIGILLSP